MNENVNEVIEHMIRNKSHKKRYGWGQKPINGVNCQSSNGLKFNRYRQKSLLFTVKRKKCRLILIVSIYFKSHYLSRSSRTLVPEESLNWKKLPSSQTQSLQTLQDVTPSSSLKIWLLQLMLIYTEVKMYLNSWTKFVLKVPKNHRPSKSVNCVTLNREKWKK